VQSGNSFRPSTFDYSKPIYDPNYADNITGYQKSSQFFQPVYQPQYQNFNTGNPFNVSQYGQQPSYGGGTGGGLTPEIARTLMQRSMTKSGAPTSEFNKYGGYDKVQSMYERSGGDYSGQGNSYPQQQFNPYTNNYGFGSGMPQMQSPFNYGGGAQLPQSMYGGVYGNRGGTPPTNYQQQFAAPRGNTTRRAEGGIASLMDDVE
jgi:hypothetical protein